MELNRQLIWKLSVIGLILLVLWKVISEPDTVSRMMHYAFQLLTPIIMGIAIALLLNTVLSYIEERFQLKRHQGLLIVYLVFIGILVISAVTLVPRIYSSLVSLIEELPFYIRQIDGFLAQLNTYLKEYNATIAQAIDFSRFEERYSGWVETAVLSSVSYVSSFTMTLINFLIGIVISIYLLKDKEVFARMFTRLLYAMLPVASAKTTIDIFQEMDYIFKRYIIGKSLDCLIIGVMAVIGRGALCASPRCHRRGPQLHPVCRPAARDDSSVHHHLFLRPVHGAHRPVVHLLAATVRRALARTEDSR